jgi:adenosine deaminase
MTRLADLHRHLDGSLRMATLLELANSRGVTVPPDLRFTPAMGLPDALARFAVTLAVLKDAAAVRRVAREICEDAAREGVTTLEIRFAPQLHDGRVEDIVDAALDGIDGRAGLILCGLYGESIEVLCGHVEMARTRKGVVGIDLAGGPSPAHAVRLADYAVAFRRAEELGIGRTVHAAEGRDVGEIRTAIVELHAQRIGHGTTLLDDDAIVDLVLERGVVIEACPTSNVHTGAIATREQHPMARWLARGVRVCINTDNTLLSDVDAPTELAHADRIDGMSRELVERCVATGHAAAFHR